MSLVGNGNTSNHWTGNEAEKTCLVEFSKDEIKHLTPKQKIKLASQINFSLSRGWKFDKRFIQTV